MKEGIYLDKPSERLIGDLYADEHYFKKELKRHQQSFPFDPKPRYETYKRLFDIFVCLILLVPSILLIMLLAILIVLESPGSPIFSQVRVGQNGKLFVVHKMRSMKKDAEANGQKWAEKNDPRITRIGRFIRKVRLDELPQLYDILAGHMSLVGPRPEVPLLTRQFEQQHPGFVTRLLVKPGLTGLAQVNGGYDIAPEKKWQIDCDYIQRRSWKLDLKIIGWTILTILTREGAR